MTLEILQEFGSPEKVASSYQGERFLIGPRLYPAFIKVLQIVLPIMGVLALVGLGFSLARSQPAVGSILEIIAKSISEFAGAVISGLGSITIIFAILERFVPDLKARQPQWDAHTLLKISPPDQVKIPELIVEFFFSGLAILIFNFYPQIIGFTPSLNSLVEGGNWQDVTFIPIFSEVLLRYVPYMTVIWGLTIVLDGILILRGHWEPWSRWFTVGLKALGIALAAVMLVGPSLIAWMSIPWLPPVSILLPTAQILVTLMTQAVRLGLILAILFGGLDLGRDAVPQFSKV